MAIKSPRQIKDFLDHYIVGQDSAKKTVSSALFMHHMRYKYNHTPIENKGGPVPKQNALILGPSGSGKSYIVQKACEYIGVPFYEVPALDIAPEGWAGLSFREHMTIFRERMYAKYDNADVANLEMKYSVIFVDEIDKICIPAVGNKGGDHNQLIQHSLLKLIEGADLQVSGEFDGRFKRKINFDRSTVFPTHNVLFICAGHFESVHISRKELRKRSIGFVNNPNPPEAVHKHLAKAGMIPELLGRLPLVDETIKLSKQELARIVLTAEDSIVEKYKRMFSYLGEDMKLSREDIDRIVNYCYSQDIGVRGLDFILYEVLREKVFNLQEY